MALYNRIQGGHAGRSWSNVGMHHPKIIKGMIDTLIHLSELLICLTEHFAWGWKIMVKGKAREIYLSSQRTLCHFCTLVCFWVGENVCKVSNRVLWYLDGHILSINNPTKDSFDDMPRTITLMKFLQRDQFTTNQGVSGIIWTGCKKNLTNTAGIEWTPKTSTQDRGLGGKVSDGSSEVACSKMMYFVQIGEVPLGLPMLDEAPPAQFFQQIYIMCNVLT